MLEEMSWPQAREAFKATRTVLIPVGSTEQHGPHLPLGTDFLVASALARAAAAETGVLCAPAIPVGVSDHHRQFWGTLSVAPETLRAYVHDVAKSLVSHGATRLVFVNGHGGNAAALDQLCRDLRSDEVYAVLWEWWWSPRVQELQSELFESRGSHAGPSETSLVWALQPELVRADRFEEAATDAPAVYGAIKHGAHLPLDTLDFSPSGATLDPREATQEAGEKLLRIATDELASLIRWLEAASTEELKLPGHKP